MKSTKADQRTVAEDGVLRGVGNILVMLQKHDHLTGGDRRI